MIIDFHGCIDMHMHISICTHILMYVYIHMYVCIHMYVYIDTYIHCIYIYIYMYVYRFLWLADRFRLLFPLLDLGRRRRSKPGTWQNVLAVRTDRSVEWSGVE